MRRFELTSCFFYLTGQRYTELECFLIKLSLSVITVDLLWIENMHMGTFKFLRFILVCITILYVQIRIGFPLEYIIIGIFCIMPDIGEVQCALYSLLLSNNKKMHSVMKRIGFVRSLSLFSILWKKKLKKVKWRRQNFFLFNDFFSLTK